MKYGTDIFRSVVLLLIFGISVSGCKKLLDQKPLGRLSQEDLGGGFEGQVFGLYSTLRGQFYYGSCASWMAINSMRSDDASAGSNNGDNAGTAPMYDDFSYAKDNWLLADAWTTNYSIAGLANNIILGIDSAKLTDPASLEQRAEAKFFRAWSYFALVREFGEVPKIDFKVYKDADANKPKASISEIYALIDSDLTEAAAVLPLQWDAQYKGRVTKGSAEALHARTFLFRGNWAAALAACQSIISSNQYSLFPDFFGQFTKANENCSESIFEVQAIYTQESDDGYPNNDASYSELQGARGQGDWDLGWGWNVPTPDLASSFEPGDPRRAATLVYLDSANAPYNEIIPRSGMVGDLSPTVFYFNKKGVYTDPADRTALGQKHGRWMNVRLIRYGEVLVTAAEAANELGGAANDSLAVNLIEMLRARARVGANVLPKINFVSQSQMRDAIRKERRSELAMEGERFYDLVRWGTAKDVFAALGINYQDKNKYFPIPQGEIDKSNGVLIQNPDYP